MEYENALNFLLYSYFGIDGGIKTIQDENSRETITKCCAQRAYKDLARTIKYAYSVSYIDSHKSDNGVAHFLDERKTRVENICDNILKSTRERECLDSSFNEWHEQKCTDIMNIMNATHHNDHKLLKEGYYFSIGQTQKWVNMTLKYVWLLDMLPKGLTERSLHAPIDSYILHSLKEHTVDGVTGSGETYSYQNKTWSALDDYDTYMELQKAIKEIAEQNQMTPIAWEESAWIKVAEKRKNSRNNKAERYAIAVQSGGRL